MERLFPSRARKRVSAESTVGPSFGVDFSFPSETEEDDRLLASDPLELEMARPLSFDEGQDVWLVDFNSTIVEVIGQDWPEVYVEKWERNGIGERRFLGARWYGMKGFAREEDVPSGV